MMTKKVDRNAKLITIGIVTVIAVSWRVIPTYAAIAQVPIKEAALLAKAHGYDAHLWKFNMPSFIVYREKIVKRTKPEAGEVVLTRKNHLDAFNAYTILYEKHGIILAIIGDSNTSRKSDSIEKQKVKQE